MHSSPIKFSRAWRFGCAAVTLDPSPEATKLVLSDPTLARGVREQLLPWVLQKVLDSLQKCDTEGYSFMGSLSGFDEQHAAEMREHNNALYAGAGSIVSPEALGSVAIIIGKALHRGSEVDVVHALQSLVFPRLKPDITPTVALAVDSLTIDRHLIPSLAWISPLHNCRAAAARARVIAAVGRSGALLHHCYTTSAFGRVILPRLVRDPAVVAAIRAGKFNPLSLFSGVVDEIIRTATVPTTLGGLLPADAPLPRGGLVVVRVADAPSRDGRFGPCAGQRLLLDVVVAVAAALYPDAPPVVQPPRVTVLSYPAGGSDHAAGAGLRLLDHPELGADAGVIYDSLGDCAAR